MTKLPNSFRPNLPNPMVKVVSQHPIRTKLGPFYENSDQLPYKDRKMAQRKVSGSKLRSLAQTGHQRVKFSSLNDFNLKISNLSTFQLKQQNIAENHKNRLDLSTILQFFSQAISF